MLSHQTPPTRDLGRRAVAQRRLRRSAAHRLFCSTNGCATLLLPEAGGRHASCPICGLRRRLDDEPRVPAAASVAAGGSARTVRARRSPAAA